MATQRTTTTTKESALPRGTGSVQMRRRTYWMIYSDELGKRIQENTKQTERDAAERVLVERAIEVLEARIALLKGLQHETSKAESARALGKAGDDTRRGGRRESLRDDAPKRRVRKTTARGGKK
jgi:hypothetical protein